MSNEKIGVWGGMSGRTRNDDVRPAINAIKNAKTIVLLEKDHPIRVALRNMLIVYVDMSVEEKQMSHPGRPNKTEVLVKKQKSDYFKLFGDSIRNQFREHGLVFYERAPKTDTDDV